VTHDATAGLEQALSASLSPLLADQRPILGPEAAVQGVEPGTVGIRQISTPN